MRRESISVRLQHHLINGAMFTCLGLMAGCIATPPTLVVPVSPASPEPLPLDPTPVVRHGRYALVELVPQNGQGDLMQQIVDITFPAAVIQSVTDAIRYLLLHSGYRMSEDCEAAHTFDELALPAAHAHVGPLTLHNALQVLIGPGWQLHEDDASRMLCFTRRDSAQPADDAIRSDGAQQ